MIIFILVSPLSCIGLPAVQAYSFTPFYHMSWSIAILSYCEFSIVIFIE